MLPTFTGTSSQLLDEKNRLAIPARFRDRFDTIVYLTAGDDGCIAAYTPAGYEQAGVSVMEESATTVAGRDARRDFFGRTAELRTDGQGRVVVPQFLLEHAGLGKDVLVVGLGEWFEFWDAKRHAAWKASRQTAKQAGG